MRWVEPAPDVGSGTLGGVLRAHADLIGDAPFLVLDGERYSFAQVDGLANAFARGFRAVGVAAGHPVSLFMENSRELIFAALGLNKLGAFWVPVNTAFKREYLAETIRRSRARHLLVDRALATRVEEVWSTLHVDHVVVTDGAQGLDLPGATLHDLRSFASHPPGELDAKIDYRDVAAVLWTSGTTGMPKGVVQPHFTWLYNAASMNKARDVREGDIFHNVLPMYNSGAWILGVIAALQAGLPVACDPRFSVSKYWESVRRYGATQLATLGAMHIHLWQAPPDAADADNPARIANMTPMPSTIFDAFRERFGLEYIVQISGQSEVMGWAYADKRRPSWKPNSSGWPRDDLDMEILDAHDRPVGANEPGEICIRPKVPFSLFGGYYANTEATLATYRNLWYHTGDLGRVDADGELFFIDRKSDFMRYKGRNVSSIEVEHVVGQHDAVQEVAAHGVRSAELESESEVKICVVLKPGMTATAEELAGFVNQRAPYYMVPRYIQFYAELPHTQTGKVQKFRLQEAPVTDETWDAVAAGFEASRD